MDAIEARRRAEEVNRRYHHHRNWDRLRRALRFALLPSFVAVIPGAGISSCIALQQVEANPALAAQMVFGGALIAVVAVGFVALVVGYANEAQKPD